MPLQPPRLDDRDFESLFREALTRIPHYLPEWTDWNESDPGITLLQLQSWLTETVLFRLNRLPDLNYVKFLQLLGVEQRPALAARADLTFILKETVDAAEVLIEQGSVVGVAERDLPAPLFFETDRTLTAISARLEVLLQVDNVVSDVPVVADVTQSNSFDRRTFTPFGDPAGLHAGLVLGFSSPLPFSRQEIGLQVYLAEEGQALLAPVLAAICGPEDQDEDAPRLAWQWWDGLRWDGLDVTADETRRLTQSGQVYFRVPGQIPAVSYQTLGLPPLGDEEEQPPLHYWLRVVLQSGAYARAPKIDRVLTNTVRATAALTVFDEAVGSSDGTPNQTMALRHSPVLSDPRLELEVDEGEGPRPWVEVTDFFDSGPDDPHYLFNRNTGQIAFGDGRRGRIPVAGQFNVIARQYRYGGGQVGNVGAGTITDLATPIAEVEEVTNFRPAEGGADEERLRETMLRAPREVKARDRAVTLEDFALLAQETPGAMVARAAAYPATTENGGGQVINVVIVPLSEAAKPVPTEAARRMVCRYLDERRLVTTRVRVAGPTYHDFDVVLDVRARDDADLKTAKNVLATRFADYFHPLRGGQDGEGWSFGRDIYYSELLREIMLIPGVARVESLQLRKFLARFDSEAAAQAEMEALLAAERSAFPDACPPTGEVLQVVEPPHNGDDAPRVEFYAAAVYDCCDLPVAAGALVALRRSEISVSYLRPRGLSSSA